MVDIRQQIKLNETIPHPRLFQGAIRKRKVNIVSLMEQGVKVRKAIGMQLHADDKSNVEVCRDAQTFHI